MNYFLKSFLDGAKPDKQHTVSEWADKFAYLPASSSEQGKYSTDRVPYMREVMDNLTINSGVNEVIVMAGAQLAKTTNITNAIGYIMDCAPSPILCWFPTESMAKQYAKTKLNPFIESTPALKNVFRTKDENNILEKSFKGCTLHLLGASSPNSFNMHSAPYLFLDEVDRWETDLSDEGDPINLAKRRALSYGKKMKMFMSSTPTISFFSQIEKQFLRGDQRYYNVPCPHCGEYQVLDFTNLKYKRLKDSNVVDKNQVYYECKKCKGKIEEHHKTIMLHKGKWVPTNKKSEEGVRSYQISSLYSPVGWGGGWSGICQEWVDANYPKNIEKIKAFKNTVLGVPFMESSARPNFQLLFDRKDPTFKSFEVPQKVVALYAGVDVQDDRLCISVHGFGPEQESYVIYYDEIVGHPTKKETWDRLKMICERAYKHQAGIDIFIKGIAIDTGGHFTEYVYNFCRKNGEKYYPVKGSSHDFPGILKSGKDLDFDPETGEIYKDSTNLYIVNTYMAKDTIYTFLNLKEVGPGYVHFNNDLQLTYFEMLTSEQKITKWVNGRVVKRFAKPNDGVRNESLDTFVYAYALARSKGVDTLYGDEYERVYNINILNKIKEKNKNNIVLENKVLEVRDPLIDMLKKKQNGGDNDFLQSSDFKL